MSNLKTISIIGARGYPAEFIGTSGLEVYLEKTVDELLKISKNYRFIIYTKVGYQPKETSLPRRILVKPLPTIRSKVLESVIYGLFASFLAAFDSSSIIWYHGVGPAFFSFIPKLFGKEIILTVHALDWERAKWSPLERVLFRWVAKLVFTLKPKVFTVGRSLKNFISKKWQVDVVYTPKGVILSLGKVPAYYLKRFGLSKNSYLLYLGRLVPEKRVEWLMEAYLKLKDKFPDLKLVIAGGHGNLPKYEKRLKAKYEDPGIVWTGYVFGKEKRSLLSYCRCFVLPSELEGGNPLSLLEALEASAFCVVSDEAVEEFKDLGNVFTFAKNDKRSFRKKLAKAVRQAENGYRYNKREIERLKESSWSKTARVYDKIFTNYRLIRY